MLDWKKRMGDARERVFTLGGERRAVGLERDAVLETHPLFLVPRRAYHRRGRRGRRGRLDVHGSPRGRRAGAAESERAGEERNDRGKSLDVIHVDLRTDANAQCAPTCQRGNHTETRRSARWAEAGLARLGNLARPVPRLASQLLAASASRIPATSVGTAIAW